MEPGLAGFETVAEISADDRARIALTKAGVHASDRFLIATRASGEILLTPVTSIPKREVIVWEDQTLRDSLFRGLADAASGRIRRLPDLLDEPPA